LLIQASINLSLLLIPAMPPEVGALAAAVSIGLKSAAAVIRS
jgi:hypothetical protein